MNIGANIRRIRKSKGIFIKDLSAKSGISLTSIHYIESGVNSPTVKTLEKLAAALGVTVGELLEQKAG